MRLRYRDRRPPRWRAQRSRIEEDLLRRQQTLDEAFALLKNVGFVSVELEMVEAVEEITRLMGDKLWTVSLPSPERLEYLMKVLDVRGAAYVKLVSDVITQEAFATILKEFALRAWEEEYIGIVGIEPLPGNVQFQAFQTVALHWEKESYKRLRPSRALCSDAFAAITTMPAHDPQFYEAPS